MALRFLCFLSMVSQCQKRISGPLLDRIDIHIEVPRVEYDKLTDGRLGEESEDIRTRLEKAREVQRQRFADTSLICNADMGRLRLGSAVELTRRGVIWWRFTENGRVQTARAIEQDPMAAG